MVADNAKDPERRITALASARERATALGRILEQYEGQAQSLAKEKGEARQIREKAAATQQAFRNRLARTYRDPAAAEEAWRRACGDKGLKQTMREVARNPELLGQLPGWRVWVFASADRREAEWQAAGLVELGADARVLGGKAAAARTKLQQLERQERNDPGLREYAEARNELGSHRISNISAAIDRAECDLVAKWAKEVAVVGPGQERGKVSYRWAPGLAQAEQERRERLFDKHRSHAKAELVREFQRRDPQSFQQWERAQQMSRGRSHGRG